MGTRRPGPRPHPRPDRPTHSPTTRSTGRPTRAPAPGSAGPAAATRRSPTTWPGSQAAEPHATAERLIELEREAAQATRQPAAYYDVTVSFSKSISVLHASLRENERRARLAGDQQAAAYWAGREQAFQEVLHRANRAALEYLQAWAGITRTGYHGTRIDGREPGRFEPAGLIVTSWLQGTSRDGDPQDHIHNQIARITRTFRDGKWRALDTMSVRAVLGALQAIAATTVECELTREFGVDWIPRADGRGNEIQRHHAGADGRLLHAHGAGAREGTRARAGVGAQARPRADLARAAAHRQRRHAPVAQGQGRGRDRLGRAGAAVGRHPRRRTGRHRARRCRTRAAPAYRRASITPAGRRPDRPRPRPRPGHWPRPWSWCRTSIRPGPGTTCSSSWRLSCPRRPGR